MMVHIPESGKFMSASEYAYTFIKELILNGDLQPDQRINWEEIAAQLNISRVPIRDALAKLESESLVVSIPRRGMYVAPLSLSQINHIFNMRALLEPLALLEAFPRITPDVISRLRKMLDNQVDTTDIKLILEQNQTFHFSIFELAGDDILYKVLDLLWVQCKRYRLIYFKNEDNRERIVDEHYEILNLIERKQVQAAVDLIVRHTRKSQEILLRIFGESIAPPTEQILVSKDLINRYGLPG